MKQKKLIACAAIFLMACTSNENTETKTQASSAQESSLNMYGYTPTYSAKFEMGSNANTEKVLSLYKAWDDNTLDNVNDAFSDSVFIYPWDGAPITGPRDSVMATMKSYRGSFSSMKSTLNAVLGAKETEKNEDWVLVWVNEVYTDNAGKTDSTSMQETWGLDKDGKVRILYQYGQKNM